jgi:alkylation response protein AidB-like acyl-CoA dehydrogenase
MRVTTEQIELRDVVRRFLAEKITSEYLRARMHAGVRHDAELRTAFQSLGLYDAFSGTEPPCGIVELGLIAEECGRFLVPDALLENVLISTLLESLLSTDDRAVFADVVQPAGGACTVAFFGCSDFSVAQGQGLVSGVAQWASGQDDAVVLLGFAKTAAGRRGFLAKLPQSEGSVVPVASLDLTTPLRRISLVNVPCVVLSAESTEALEVAVDIVKASEVSGLCQRVVEMTVEYAKTRQQFGVPIGSFQAIQQKLAQAHADTEALSSLCRFAAWSFKASPEQRRLTAKTAVFKAAELGPQVCETAIQCHGGIGFTWEYDLHLFLRRAKVIQSAFAVNEDSAGELIGAIA